VPYVRRCLINRAQVTAGEVNDRRRAGTTGYR